MAAKFNLYKTIINTITQNPDNACYILGLAINSTHIATYNSNMSIKLYSIEDFSVWGELIGNSTYLLLSFTDFLLLINRTHRYNQQNCFQKYKTT